MVLTIFIEWNRAFFLFGVFPPPLTIKADVFGFFLVSSSPLLVLFVFEGFSVLFAACLLVLLPPWCNCWLSKDFFFFLISFF